jgi:hypothetical protein
MRTRFLLVAISAAIMLCCGCTRSGYEPANRTERKMFGPGDLAFTCSHLGHHLDDVLARLGRPDRITRLSEAEAREDHPIYFLHGDGAEPDGHPVTIEVWRYDRQFGRDGWMIGELDVDLARQRVFASVTFRPEGWP